ncbi:fibrous sheath-interacting protein 2-like isoform X3 [Elephas maximus indicus]|uniref:fibrous sheath-interacting protein 2-like isoform X3 n=1 Tax=Elephas maximus indicus TaxID=99487 RepID=UPI002116373B|nr:fibrous sheath-interacting protein 2-like isoform X3 [Elephas maximus indicus]
MELYLSNSKKAAEAAASKAAASSLKVEKEQCSTGLQKKPIPEIGAANLLDLPLGVKLPVIPGSTNVFYTTDLNEKLYQPSYDFNLTDPYCRLLETSYQSLHDPHLKSYHRRKDILRHLKEGGYITRDNKVVCTVKELNKYRQYLTSLKLDFERNYIREQKMIEKQINTLYESRRALKCPNIAQFQEWLFDKDSPITPEQDQLLKYRYLDMIRKELDKDKCTADKQSTLQKTEEERRHRDHIRRNLSLREQIEEEWKTKEMLLLTKIGEEVKREARIEEQRQKRREEIDRKKQALIEKKVAYHLQKIQKNGSKREVPEDSPTENKGEDGAEASFPKIKRTSFAADTIDQSTHHGEKRAVHHSQDGPKTVLKKSPALIPQRVHGNRTEPKTIRRSRELSKPSCILVSGGTTNTKTAPTSPVSPKKSVLRHSIHEIPKQELTRAEAHEKRAKKLSSTYEPAKEAVPAHNSPTKEPSCGHHCCQEKVTSEELNSITQNVMMWVVASVTSILYPAITKYEERLRNSTRPVSDESLLSSDSCTFYSTCTETPTCEHYTSTTAKTFQAEPCANAIKRSIARLAVPLRPPSAHTERTVVGTAYHRKGHSESSEFKCSTICKHPEPTTCKSDTHLFTLTGTGLKKSKDAATETDGLEYPLSSDRQAKAVNEVEEVKNVFDNFKCHLKEETELILESIFQEMVCDLTEAIPCLSSVTTDILVDQIEADRGGLLSGASISSAAAEIVENMLEKLQSAVDKKCIEAFSQDLSACFKPDLATIEEQFISPVEKPLKVPLPYTWQNTSDIAEDIVHVILEKLMALASSKQHECPGLEVPAELGYQQHKKDPTYTFLQKASKRKSSTEPDGANLIGKEEIEHLVSNIFSQSSLVGYIEDAISTILGYIQIELNNEKLIATEETVIILQLLDDILTQLHQGAMKANVRKGRCPRLRSPSRTGEKKRLASTRAANGPRSRGLLPPINVPGMVLYSEDENEEIDKIVENVLISSIEDEEEKLQVPSHWLKRENADFEYKRNTKSPIKPASRSKVAFRDWGSKTDHPTFNNEDFFKERPCSKEDVLIFTQDETHQIQKASENIITSILAEILKDISSVSPGHSDHKNDKDASLRTSGKPRGLSQQEWVDQMFPVSEIRAVAQEIADAVLKILHVTLNHDIDATRDAMCSSSVHETSLNDADISNEDPLKMWFQSKKKMKFLSSLSVGLTKPPWLESGERHSAPESVVDVNDKITHAIFKRLKSFIFPKLQKYLKPENHAASSKLASCHPLAMKLSFQFHLGTYTTKVVNIVLDAIHDELERNKKYLNLRESSPPKSWIDTGYFANTEKELDSVVTNLNNDIMTSSLVTCICEMLSVATGEGSVPLPSDKLGVKIPYGTANINKAPYHCFPMQEATPSEIHKCLTVPHTRGSVFNEKDFKKNARFQVLNRIEDTLYNMLCKLVEDHSSAPLSDNDQNREWTSKKLRMTTVLQSNIQLISNTVLEDIITKLCSVERESIFSNSEFKAILEYFDTDSLSFASLMEEMTKCTDVISSMVSSVIKETNEEVTNSKARTAAPKIGSTKENHSNKLKALASDILKTVFAKLEGFAMRNLETLDIVTNGNKNSNTMVWESKSTNICTGTSVEQVQSVLHMHARKLSSAILKIIHTELNVSLPGTGLCVNLVQKKQMLKNLVNLILDTMPPDIFSETELEERAIEKYRYRPIYGNFLPGGAEPDSSLEDRAHTEKGHTGEERPTEEETKSDSLKQWELEMTLKKIEVELKEPQKSPVVPIVRKILNEIFENDLLDHFNVPPLPRPHLCDTPHAGDETVAQASVPFRGKTMGPLVSEADVIAVTDGVIRTVIQKLYAVAVTERNENRSSSFPERASGGKDSMFSTILDRKSCTFQSRFTIDKLTKVNVVEDIVQSVLTNLEIFITSKVKSLFCPAINVTVPVALFVQQNESSLSQLWLSSKDSYSGDRVVCCSVGNSKSGKTTSKCQMTVSRLNTYATEVARQVLQGIKHKLDEQIKSPFLTHNVVAFKSIPSQIVNTMLDIMSTKGKYEKHISGREIDINQPESIVEKLFNKTDYQKQLQFQILDTIEGILSDICEKTLDENNLPLVASTLQSGIDGRDSGPKSQVGTECPNRTILKFLVPESCVMMMSNDTVNIVLRSLRSIVVLGINAKNSISARPPVTFSNAFPEAERQQPSVVGSTNERNREIFLLARKGKSRQQIPAYSNDNQTNILKKQDTKKTVPDPCEENAHFITKAILNSLKSFVTERIDLLLTFDSQTGEESFVSPKFARYEEEDSLFLESNQMPLDVNILKTSTAKTILSQVTDHTLASYRQKHRPAIHISQASLKEYADIIASTILMIIKNDVDLEMQKMYLYPNKTSFQENIVASETVNNILKNLCDKRSLQKSSFYSKQNPSLFTQIDVQEEENTEILPGQSKMEDHTDVSLFSECVNQNQMVSKKNERRILDEVFMRNKGPRQEKTTALLSVVKEVLKKVHQRIIEDVDHLPPFNEPPYFTADSKCKTSASIQKKTLQSHINNVANDIVESIFGKMFSIVMTSLYENNETKGKLEAPGKDKSPVTPSHFRRLKDEKRSILPEFELPRVYPYSGITGVTPLETVWFQHCPLRVGEELVQMVLNKIVNFALLNLEEGSSPKSQSDEMRSLRPCSSKGSPKGSPKPGFKANLKARSKVTSLPKFGAKPQVGPSGAKAKNKTKSSPGEKIPRGARSKTAIGLSQILATGDSKNSARTKLPTAELKMYAKNIVSNVLETIMDEFQTVRQATATVSVKALPSDQITTASEIVNGVLQGLYATKNSNLAHPIKCSHSDDPKLAQKNLSSISLASSEAQFSLENVSSQLEKIFPKENVFKQMFGKWQTESNGMENEKYKLLMIAKTVLNEILIKAKELGESGSLLNPSPLETCEIRYHDFKRSSSKAEDAQVQINIFSREIVERLFEKLELCFLTQLRVTDSKETLASKQETTAASKHGSLRRNNLNNVPICNTKLKDKIVVGPGNRIAQDIIEEILHILESFADLQFKHVSSCAFSEIVKIPVKSFFSSQQKPLMKTKLPKLQPLNKFPDESKSSRMISQENIQNTLRQLYSFHSELLTYTANTVNDMLHIIKNKLDREIHQVEPSSVSIFEQSRVAIQIVGTLMDQCTHFYESLIKNHAKENLIEETENTYSVSCAELASKMEMTASKLKGASCGDDLQIRVPNLLFCSEEVVKQKGRASSNLPQVPLRCSVGNTTNTSEAMGRLESALNPSYSGNEVRDLSHFDQATKGNSSLPEDSILHKPPKKSSDYAEAVLTQDMSFFEMGKGEKQRVVHREPPKPAVQVSQIQTTVSPLKICLAAENTVNTMLLSYGLPGQLPNTNENVETIKPFFVSKERPFSVTAGEQKDEEKNLLKMWGKRVNYKTKEKNKSSEASGEDFPLLKKWKNKKSPSREKTESLKEAEVMAFANQELGTNEIHVIARYVATSVVTYFKSFETRGLPDEKVPIISTLSRQKYESEHPLRSTHRDSSLNQLCEHLTKLVLSHMLARISDSTEEAGIKQKGLDSQDATFSKVILVHSLKCESRSIPISELALSISEIIIRILFNSDILKADITQEMVSVKTKYIYCPSVDTVNIDDLFQDLLIGVTQVLSRETGINHQLDSKGRNKSSSTLRSPSLPTGNQTKTTKRQLGPGNWKSASTRRINQLVRKNQLNSLVCKLDSLVSSLKTRESKEVVDKIFNIVLDLFLPDECPIWDMDSGKIARKLFPSSNNQPGSSILGNNLGLSPKSVFLLNVVCEKLIRILLEGCTANNLFTNGPFSDEVSAEECQLFDILQNVEDEEFGYSKGTIDYGSLAQDHDMSDLLENLAETDQESMLSVISHSMVKSLMEKLSHSVQQPSGSPPFTPTYLKYRTRERLPSLPRSKRPELKESRQGKDPVRFMSYDSKPLTRAVNNLRVTSSKIQAPFSESLTVKPSSSPIGRPREKTMDAAPTHNMLQPGGISTGVYSAKFLEEIISDVFLHLFTSLWNKNDNITEVQLNEMSILGVSSVVNEFNNAQVTVLRDVEENLCFPPVYKETVSKIVDTVYNDILRKYELQVAYGDNLAHVITSVAQQITHGILIEILAYELPVCYVGKLTPNSYYPLEAKNILQKLQNSLRELHYPVQHLIGYTTMLSHSFLEDVIRRLLSQLIPLPSKASCLGKKYFMTSDFNELSTCIINKVMLAISKHKIWLTQCDHHYLYTEENLQKMVESVYNNILQISDSLVSIQKSVVSQSPLMVDRMASLIIQEIIENHLQPFLCGEGVSHSRTSLDEISSMVKEVLIEATEAQRSQKPLSVGMGICPKAFVEEIVARLVPKIFDPKYNTALELGKITQKIVNSIHNHFNKAKICILRDGKEPALPLIGTDTLDELVESIYRNFLIQHGLIPDIDNKEFKDSDIFMENIASLIVGSISDYLFHPLFSGDLSTYYYSTLTAEDIVQNILGGISKSTKPSHRLSPYNTLLPYTFLEDIIRMLLSRIFPSADNRVPCRETPKDRSEVNFSEISSKLISDIKVKISQHEIRFSKDDEETEFAYSEDDTQHLVDSVFRNILQNSESQDAVERDLISGSNALIDRVAGFIIKNICQQHLNPSVYGKLLLPSAYPYLDDARRQQFFIGVYSSAFLEDVIFGVLSKIFHRVMGTVQTKFVRESQKELLETAEKLLYLTTEEFSKAQVGILENAKEQLCLPPVARDVVIKIIGTVYSKVLQEYSMEPDKDFLHDTKMLAKRITKVILAETFDFQIHPDFLANRSFKLDSKLNTDVLTKRVRYDIIKSRLQRQTSTIYTTVLSHTHLEKIVSQILSQISPLYCSAEDPGLSQSDLSNTVLRMIDEIMSVISKHAICIIKHGNGKQNVISEKEIQAMADAIYADFSHSNLFQSLKRDKKGISNMPVTEIASYMIKEIFNHHLQSFLSEDKTLPSGPVDRTYKKRASDPKQRELSFIMNSAVFLEEVISELLCKILYAFSHNILAAKNPYKAKASTTDIVTTLVRSIVLEFSTSEILVADNLDENLYLSEQYKEMVHKTVNLIYEKILGDYKSLIHVYRAIQSDVIDFGRKIFYLLLGEMFDYQMESLISGELAASYCSLQEENILRNVLHIVNDGSRVLPSCITVLPRPLLEDVIYKLLAHIFPLSEMETELKEEEVPPDYESVNAASKLVDEIITEISEHEVRLATAEEHAESMQLGAMENFIDCICNNIMTKFKFQAEAQEDTSKQEGSFIRRLAGFIMEEIMDYHLKPFLHNEESSASTLPENDHAVELCTPGKEKALSFPQPSVYSATFLKDVVIDLVHKFYALPSNPEDPKDKEVSEGDLVDMAIKFANALTGEFRKSEIKVLENAEEMFSFPPIDKDTVDKVSDSVYDEVMEIYRSNNLTKKDGSSDIVIEIIAALAEKAISAFKIQPLFSGNWSSILFSFLDVDSIIQRVQHLPFKSSTKRDRSLEENPLSLLEQSSELTVLTSGPKTKIDTLAIDRGATNRKENLKKEETSMEKDCIHEPVYTAITSIMSSRVIPLASVSAENVANKNKKHKKKKKCSIRKDSEKVSKVTFPTTSVKSKDIQGPDLSTTLKKNEIEKNDGSARKDEEGPGDRIYKHISPATDDTKTKKVVLEPDLKTDDKKQCDDTRESTLGKEDGPLEILSLKSMVRNKETRERRTESAVVDGKQILDPKCVQTVTESIYSNVLEISFLHGRTDDSKFQNPPGERVSSVTQVYGRNFAQPASTGDLTPSACQEVLSNEEEKEKSDDKEMKSKPDRPQNPPENKPGVLPVNFLEDIIAEIANKLIFSSLPATHDACQNVTNDVNQAELYDTAMKLIDSLLKEFSDAQIKLLSPEQGNQLFSSIDKMSPVHKVPHRQKEPSVDKAPPKITIIPMAKIPAMYSMATAADVPSDEVPFIANMPSISKSLVNKVVHASICNILLEYGSQGSICGDINSNGNKLARRLASAVIEEIFQHQLDFLLCDVAPSSVYLPLESKEVIKKLQKVTETACKECQTSLPHTIMLPHKFLENIISSLLSKIFSTVANTETEIFENNSYTELDFLQMKLVSTIMTQIAKDKDMIIQYVDSLHPNDGEIIQLVAQTIYNNLLPQFASQEIIQNCVSKGCRILSETIVSLVVREVAGNQLQNYFSEMLSPHQCTAVDSVAGNILQNVIQNTEVVQPQPSYTYKLPFNIIEEIAVNFLSKLLSMFPKADKEQSNSLNPEMQKITSKILNSLQEYISKSQIKVVPQAKENTTISSADSATIEKVVSSVYNSVLKHSGSHTSVFKDLMGQSNVLADIIGFLMVKEISNSELQPQMEEEASSSELLLEAVIILDKVTKIIDDLKSKEKPASRKGSVLDAMFLEETLALFLAKLAKLPCASNRDAKTLSKPELNKIASQLTKSVTAEISKNNISIVATNPEEHHLTPENTEMISQVVDSVYNHVLQQSGTHEDLYHDMKGTNRFFPQKVASLITSKISNYPLETTGSKTSSADLFGDLNVDRIVEKAHEHAVKMEPQLEEEMLHGELIGLPTCILPYRGKQPITIGPDTVAEHLGVISIKTQPLEKLKIECLERTGHSIEELRRAAVSGRSYIVNTPGTGQRQKEGRVSLDKSGRLDVKPFEPATRNSFPNLRKPDITRVALLKDVKDKKDLIIRLSAHDIDHKSTGNKIEKDLISDEDEAVLQEVVKGECFEGLVEDQVKEDMKPRASAATSPKPITSMSSLKKRLSLGKYCPKSTPTPKSVTTHSTQLTESAETQMKSILSGRDRTTSQSSTGTASTHWEKNTQSSGEEGRAMTESTHYLLHKIRSSSSYDEEDLTSFSSDNEGDRTHDPSAKITEGSFEVFNSENPSSIKTLANLLLPNGGRK